MVSPSCVPAKSVKKRFVGASRVSVKKNGGGLSLEECVTVEFMC